MSAFTDDLIPVLPPGPGVCAICHGPSGDYRRCYTCHRHATDLALDNVEVVPLALAVKRGYLATALYRYKNANDADEAGFHTHRLRALIQSLMPHVGRCVGRPGTAFDWVTWVPSRRPNDPVEDLLRSTDWAKEQTLVSLLDWQDQSVASHASSPSKFRADTIVRGDHVLLVDDTWTTGATALSAISALFDAGADRVTAVVIGRHFDPAWRDNQSYLDLASGHRVSRSVCANCVTSLDQLEVKPSMPLRYDPPWESDGHPVVPPERTPLPLPNRPTAPVVDKSHGGRSTTPETVGREYSQSARPPRAAAGNSPNWLFLIFLFPGPQLMALVAVIVMWIIGG